MKRRGPGFTLIEIIVVVAIIGILATIVIINVQNSRDRGRYARVISDMSGIAAAARAYNAANSSFPLDVGGNLMPPELASYLPGGWPVTPCSAPYVYDYNNWVDSSGNIRSIGISYYNQPSYNIFSLNIKNWSGPTIESSSVKSINCKE